jgi:hypothetical protein
MRCSAWAVRRPRRTTSRAASYATSLGSTCGRGLLARRRCGVPRRIGTTQSTKGHRRLWHPPRGRQAEAERRLPARTGRRLALVQLITATERVHKSASAGLFNTARSVWAHQMKSIQVNSFLAVIDLRRRRHLWCRRNRGRVRLNWRLSCLR